MAGEGLEEIEGMEEDSETTGRGTTSGRGIWMGSEEAEIEMPGTGSRMGLEDCEGGWGISLHTVLVVYCE